MRDFDIALVEVIGFSGALLIALQHWALVPLFGHVWAALLILPILVATVLSLDRFGFYGEQRGGTRRLRRRRRPWSLPFRLD